VALDDPAQPLVKHGRRSWLIAATAYFVVPSSGLTLTATMASHPVLVNVGLAMWLLPWPIGFVHAVIVNFGTRLPLLKR
jgi:hypothetical protein